MDKKLILQLKEARSLREFIPPVTLNRGRKTGRVFAIHFPDFTFRYYPKAGDREELVFTNDPLSIRSKPGAKPVSVPDAQKEPEMRRLRIVGFRLHKVLDADRPFTPAVVKSIKTQIEKSFVGPVVSDLHNQLDRYVNRGKLPFRLVLHEFGESSGSRRPVDSILATFFEIVSEELYGFDLTSLRGVSIIGLEKLKRGMI